MSKITNTFIFWCFYYYYYYYYYYLFETSLWSISLSWCLRLSPALLTASFLFPISNLYFWASAMIFLIFYDLYPLQTDHAVSYFLIGPFFLVLLCCCSLFYLQFYIFLIFLTLLQLPVILPYYSQEKNLYFLFFCTTFFHTDQTSSSIPTFDVNPHHIWLRM